MLGDRIKELRAKNKMSQQDLADALGLSRSHIGMIETGSRDPDTPDLTKMADLFDVTTDYLLGRVDHINGIVLEGDRLPQKYKDKGLNAVAILKDTLDENGVLSPEAERELMMLLAENRLRMAGVPRKKPKEPEKSS